MTSLRSFSRKSLMPTNSNLMETTRACPHAADVDDPLTLLRRFHCSHQFLGVRLLPRCSGCTPCPVLCSAWGQSYLSLVGGETHSPASSVCRRFRAFSLSEARLHLQCDCFHCAALVCSRDYGMCDSVLIAR